MKKAYVIIILVFFIAKPVISQKLSISAKIDANAAFLIYKKYSKQKVYIWGFGPNVGFPVNYRFNQHIGVEAQPCYSYFTPSFEIPSQKEHYRLSYLSLPIYLKINPVERLGIYLGNDVSYLVRAKMLSDGNISDVYQHFNQHLYYGLSAGLSYNYTPRFRIQFYYTYGITSLVDKVDAIDIDGKIVGDDKILLRHFEFGVAYRIF